MSQEKILGELEKKRSKRVFLDLGAAHIPAAFYGNKLFEGNDFYVGVDIDRQGLISGISRGDAKESKNFQRYNKNVILVEGRGSELPLGDASADEILLGNVMGDPAVGFVSHILKEINRVLKPQGKLIILETMTPDVVGARDDRGIGIHYGRKRQDPGGRLEELLGNFGFIKEKEMHSNDSEFETEFRHFMDIGYKHEAKEFIAVYRKNR